jgi:hypothetical protein
MDFDDLRAKLFKNIPEDREKVSFKSMVQLMVKFLQLSQGEASAIIKEVLPHLQGSSINSKEPSVNASVDEPGVSLSQKLQTGSTTETVNIVDFLKSFFAKITPYEYFILKDYENKSYYTSQF